MPVSAAAGTCVATLILLGIVSRAFGLRSALLSQGVDDVSLAPCERPGSAGRKRSERDRSESGTHKSLHREVERGAESPYLASAPFRNRDTQLPQSPTYVFRRYVDGLHPPILELDAGAARAHRRRSVSTHRRDIAALDLVTRVSELVCGFTVGRQQQHTLGHVVEPADIRETRTIG